MVVCVHAGRLGACLRIGLWLVVTETRMSCTKTAMYGMLLAGESVYLLLFGDNGEIFVSSHASDGGRWLDAPAGSTCGNACSIVLPIQRGIADRSAIPCFIFKHDGKCVPTASGKREQGSKQCCSLAVRSDVAWGQCAGISPFTTISSELFKYST